MEVAVKEKEQLNKVEINENTIKNLIYVVRGKQVMLDSDLAMLSCLTQDFASVSSVD